MAVAPEGTPFRRRVWAALAHIPYGETWSYGDLARRRASAAGRRARSERPTAPTPSPSSCPATGSSARTATSSATAAGSTARRGSSPTSGASPVFANTAPLHGLNPGNGGPCRLVEARPLVGGIVARAPSSVDGAAHGVRPRPRPTNFSEESSFRSGWERRRRCVGKSRSWCSRVNPDSMAHCAIQTVGGRAHGDPALPRQSR